jgi:cyclohexanone monooxygenase
MDSNIPNQIREVDALVVGLGYGGIYTLHHLHNELGLDVVGIDKAGGVGGTWYWNKYPGALSDSESFVYQYSFDKDLFEDNPWKTKFVTQPEILGYLNGVVDRYDLRGRTQLETSMTSAVFDESTGTWSVETDRGVTFRTKVLVTGLGLLSAINVPDFPGIADFEGQVVHTGAWPEDLDLAGKRVGVIGNGSTGGQVITALGPVAGHLTSFQRTPQYSVPAGNRPLTETELLEQSEKFHEKWDQVWNSGLAMGFVESVAETFAIPAGEREKVYDWAWNEGGGFRFMFETFGDIATDPAANEEAASFIRRKIGEIVKDPETARKLTPTDLYARRPLCDSGLYETFNRDNVELVRIDETPIRHFSEKGIITEDGVLHELDVLVLATGFDAVDGNYKRTDIRGRGGKQLADQWADAPTSYLGMTTAGFPNMFMILGPNGPFTNLPPSIETQVRWIGKAAQHVTSGDVGWMDVKSETEAAWTETCADIANQTLFPQAASWIFGANIPGKPRTVMFYLGGLKTYRELIDAEAAEGFPSFVSRADALTPA